MENIMSFDNFFISYFKEKVQNYIYKSKQSVIIPDRMRWAVFYEINLVQGQASTTIKWTRTSFSEFLSSIGGLFVTLLGTMTFFLSGYERFKHDNSLLRNIYF